MTSDSGPRLDLRDFLSSKARESLVSRLRRRRYSAGALLYQQGAPGREMYFIVSGAVRLYFVSEDGRTFVHALREAGDSVGLLSMVDGQPRAQMAEAHVDSVVDVLSLDALGEVRALFPELERALQLLLNSTVRSLIKRINSVALEPLASRVAWRLLKSARPAADGTLVISLPQGDIADLVDASRQRINTVLKTFEAEGLIFLGYGAITITDPVGLKDRISQV